MKRVSVAPDKVRKINLNQLSFYHFFKNPMLDHFLESSLLDISNKWSDIGFVEEMDIIEISSLSVALV